MTPRFPRLAAPLGLALLLGACAVGPDHAPPHSAALADSFARATADAGASAAADQAFWQGFGDPLLAELVNRAYDANQDLAAALARRDAATALLSQARLDRYPTVTASGRIGHQLQSRDDAFGASREERSAPTSGARIDALWELDLFGRVRRGVEAQRADAQASAADVRAVRIAIAADVADAYLQLRGAQERLRISRANAETQQQTHALVEARIAAGRGSDLDAARARAQLEATRSRIAAFEAAIGVNQHRLAVLTAQPIPALVARLDAPAPLPQLPDRIAPGTPGELLRRRPDIAAAEARLHGATARIGVATASLYPRFTLTGLLGSSTASYDVFREGSDTHLIALGIDWSFLDIGRVRARIAQSEAGAAERLAMYQQTVMQAAEETENALLRLSRIGAESGHLEQAAADSTRASELAQARWRAGAIGFDEVLDVERSRLQAEDAAADAAVRRAGAAVALYRALAGGWAPAQAPQASAAALTGS